MKSLKGFIVGVIVASVVGAGAQAAIQQNALTSPSSLQTAVIGCCIDFATGNSDCQMNLSVTSTGNTLPGLSRVLIPGTNGAIMSGDGSTQIAASTPVGVSSARDSYMSAMNTAAASGAAAGKFNR